MNWFNTGFKAVQQEVRANEAIRSNKLPPRIWIPQNSEITLIYLDDEGFSYYEHQYERGGSFKNFMTCPSAGKGCPLCKTDRPYLVTLFTVIDKSEWTDKQGVLHKNEKKIHALKAESAMALSRKMERWGGLKGKEVVVSRKGQKDAAAGSDFEVVLADGQMKQYTLPNKPEYQAFDYRTVFAPKTITEMCDILGISGQDAALSQGAPPSLDELTLTPSKMPERPPQGSQGGTKTVANTLPTDDDVPF